MWPRLGFGGDQEEAQANSSCNCFYSSHVFYLVLLEELLILLSDAMVADVTTKLSPKHLDVST